MAERKPGFSDEKRSENDNRKSQTSSRPTLTPVTPRKETLGERWNAVQLSKTAIFWTCLAVMAGTMFAGFTWGGWVTGSTSEKTATTTARTAVVDRLATICVAQYEQDPAKAEKLIELGEESNFQKKNYVKDQGWATMPGDEDGDTRVATACAKLIAEL